MRIKKRNITSANRGAETLEQYRVINAVYTHYQEEPDEQALTDLLADLKHHCQHVNIDFNAAVEMSEIHYQEEK